MADKWQMNKSFPETNMRMLDDEILCDITFLVGESKQPVKAHKFILASRSPVFYAMFCGPLAESSDAIHIPDIEADVFKLLLKYMYSAECAITPEMVMSLLYAANKYDVIGVATKCKNFLESNMAPDNVCTILQQAHTFDDKQLVDKCIDLINLHGAKSLQSEGFLLLSQDILKVILRSDHLGIQEEDVYTACIKWAEEKCRRLGQDVNDANCRAALGDVINLIRFPLMSLQTFTILVSERDILTSPEKLSLFQYFGYHNQKPNVCAVSDTPRSCQPTNMVYVSRFNGPLKGSWSHGGKVDAISFSCSISTSLVSVGLFSPLREGTVEGELKVLEGHATLVSQNITISYEAGVKYTEIRFPKPIRMKKDTVYTITQTFKGVSTCAGGNGQEFVSQDGLDVQFYSSDKIPSNNGTDVGSGQFKHLCFCV